MHLLCLCHELAAIWQDRLIHQSWSLGIRAEGKRREKLSIKLIRGLFLWVIHDADKKSFSGIILHCNYLYNFIFIFTKQWQKRSFCVFII